jgi:hypothetical protein
MAGDGSIHDPGTSDAIFVNAGVTHLRAVWLDVLRPGGRLPVLLTVAMDPSGYGGGGIHKGYACAEPATDQSVMI